MRSKKRIEEWKKELAALNSTVQRLSGGEPIPGVPLNVVENRRKELEWLIAQAEDRAGSST